ncbi:hypothetical protein ACMFMG_012084, partial [Clarireedia jacksonii]
KLITAPFLYVWAVLWTASIALGLLPDLLVDGYKSYNKDKGNIAEIRQVYIYSSTDILTDYKDIETYTAEAKTKGFSVALEKLKGSAYIVYQRKDESRYWEIVKKTMEG